MEIQSVTSFLTYYKSIRERTKKLIVVVPPGQMDWAYKPGKFTIADHIRHIAAMERFMFAENVLGKPCIYNGCGKELADGYENVISFMDRLHQESIAIFGNLKDSELQNKCTTPGNTQIAIWKWLRAMVEHEIHHRAELYIYLNILNINTPPIFGLSAEEVQERSLNPGLQHNK
jgi:uncharacterized damage-inducible protein DinB